MTLDRDLAARLWPIYARHAAIVFAGGAAPILSVDARWFLVTSGSPHVFWSSPAGKPLYDALGFREVDTVRVWGRGASDEDLAAVGAL